MKKPFISRVLAVVLVLVIGVLTPCSVFAKTVKRINYVSLGDSVSNGYGADDYYQGCDRYPNLRGYRIETDDAYPTLIREYMESLGYKVTHTQLACSAMRPADIYYILNQNAVRDDYFMRVFAPEGNGGDGNTGRSGEQWMAKWYTAKVSPKNPDYNVDVNYMDDNQVASAESAVHNSFVQNIQRADVITLNIGYNNIGTFLSGRIDLQPFMSAYGDDDTTQDLLDNLGVDINIAEIKAQVYDLVNRFGGVDLAAAIDYYELVAQSAGVSLDIDSLVDTLVYAYVSYAVYYSLLIDEIYRLNPDVELIVLGLYNLQNGLKLSYNGQEYDLGSVFGYMLDLMNVYACACDKNNDKYYYADTSAYDVERYYDELASGNISDSLRHRIVEALMGFDLGQVNVAQYLNGMLAQYVGQLQQVLAGINKNFSNLGANDEMEQFLTDFAAGQIVIDANYINTSDVDGLITSSAAMPRLAEVETAFNTLATLIADPNADLLAVMDAISELFKDTKLNVTSSELIASFLYKIFPLLSASASTEVISVEDSLGLIANGGFANFGTALLGGGQIDPAIKGLLSLYLRFLLADGICVHPSAAGHKALAQAAIDAYNNKVTARETAINVIIEAVNKYGPGVAEQAFDVITDYVETIDQIFGISQDIAAKVNNVTAIINGLESTLNNTAKTLENLPKFLEASLNEDLDQAVETIFNLGADLEDILYSLQLNETDLERTVLALINAVNAEKNILTDALLTLELVKTVATGTTLYAVDAAITAINNLDAALDYAFNDTIDNAKLIVTLLGAGYGAQAPEIQIAAAYIVAGLDSVQEFVNNAQKDAVKALAEGSFDLFGAAGATVATLAAATAALSGYDMDAILTAVRDLMLAVAVAFGYTDEIALASKTVEEQIAFLSDKIQSLVKCANGTIVLADDTLEKIFSLAAVAYNHLTQTESILNAKVTNLNDLAEQIISVVDPVVRQQIEAGLAYIFYENGVIYAQVKGIDQLIVLTNRSILGDILDINGFAEYLIAAINAYVQLKLDELHVVAIEKVNYIQNVIGPQVDAIVKQQIEAGQLFIADKDAALQAYGQALEQYIASMTNDVVAQVVMALAGSSLMGLDLENEVYSLFTDPDAYFAAKYDELLAANELIMTTIEMMKAFSGFGYYGIDPRNSYYVSLGDSMVTGMGLEGYENYGFDVKVAEAFPTLLSEELGVDYRQLAMGGLRAVDMLYILDENFNGDEYSLENIEASVLGHTGGTVADLRELYISELKKADLVSITMGGNEFGTFFEGQMNRYRAGQQPYEMDFSRFLGEDAEIFYAAFDALKSFAQNMSLIVDEIVAVVNAEMGYEAISTADVDYDELFFMAEVYAYSTFTFLDSYSKVLDKIHEINPDALVMIIGMYNTIDDLYYDNGLFFIDIGRLANYLVTFANLCFMTYALDSDTTIYIDISDVTMFTDEDEQRPSLNLADGEYIAYMSYRNGIASHPSAKGHEYIFEQILMNLWYEYLYLPGDTDFDWEVTPDDAIYLLYNLTWEEEFPVYQNADYDNNGIVDEQDAIYLLYYYQWPDDFPLYPDNEPD